MRKGFVNHSGQAFKGNIIEEIQERRKKISDAIFDLWKNDIVKC